MKTPRLNRSLACVALVAMTFFLSGNGRVQAADRSERSLEREFLEVVHPFLETYCFDCHGAGKQKGKLDLRPYATREAVTKDQARWESILERIRTSVMPPEEAERQPSAELRAKVLAWIRRPPCRPRSELRHLRCFVTVAEELNVSRASARPVRDLRGRPAQGQLHPAAAGVENVFMG